VAGFGGQPWVCSAATSALVLMYLRQNIGQTGCVDMDGVSRPTVSRICRSTLHSD